MLLDSRTACHTQVCRCSSFSREEPVQRAPQPTPQVYLSHQFAPLEHRLHYEPDSQLLKPQHPKRCRALDANKQEPPLESFKVEEESRSRNKRSKTIQRETPYTPSGSQCPTKAPLPRPRALIRLQIPLRKSRIQKPSSGRRQTLRRTKWSMNWDLQVDKQGLQFFGVRHARMAEGG